jgi:large subunit ribosomal protein L31
MKSNLHPTWYHNCTVSCSCGNTFIIGSTQETLQIDICDKCHPFFTGEVKFVDRQGRVDKFLKQQQMAQAKQQSKQKKSKKTEAGEAKSYRELLQDQQQALREAAKAEAAAE